MTNQPAGDTQVFGQEGNNVDVRSELCGFKVELGDAADENDSHGVPVDNEPVPVFSGPELKHGGHATNGERGLGLYVEKFQNQP